jgi:hypothetical protein
MSVCCSPSHKHAESFQLADGEDLAKTNIGSIFVKGGATMIPLVVALWEHTRFGGRKRVLVEDTPNLTVQVFNDKTSAVGVHPGPGYVAWKTSHNGQEPVVGLYEHVNYGGAVLRLTVGAYSNIHLLFNFGDVISSVRFNPPPPSAHVISPIPLVVELYADPTFTGNRLVVVEDSANIPAEFGSEFNDVTTSVRVKKGPDFSAGKIAQLYRDLNYMGGKIDLPPGDYPNIGTSHGFNDVVSSIKVR